MKNINYRENAHWTVYVHINKTNNKCYVGITSKKAKDRWRKNGAGYKSQTFYKAIKKYGWDNFEHEIIATHLTVSEASDMERLLIQKLDTIKNGYNVSLGGLHQPKIETRSIYQFDTHGNFISEYNSITEAAKKYDIPDSNINNVCSGKNKYAGKYIWRYKEDVPNIETFKNSIDISMYDNLEPVYQFDLNQCFIREYQSAIDAAHANPNCFESSILDNCRGKYKYANGYIWKFKKDVPDINEFKNKIIDFTPNYFKGHPVLQYDLDGTFIKEYSSAQVASKELDCDTHTITFACSGRTKTGKGYIYGDIKTIIKEKTYQRLIINHLNVLSYNLL